MSDAPIFSRKLMLGWIAGAVVIFVASAYLMGSKEHEGPDGSGASTYSRSAIGHAGIFEVLVLAEPRATLRRDEKINQLIKADRVLLVLPKWAGLPSDKRPGWVREVRERATGDASWIVGLIAPRMEVVRWDRPVLWTTNELNLRPDVVKPTQLMRGTGLRPVIA